MLRRSSESFRTNVATKWFFPCMNSHMFLKISTLYRKHPSHEWKLWFFVLNLFTWEKLLLQTVQVYGFSPVCQRVCKIKDVLWENLASQYVHWKGFSSLWMLLWLYKLALVLNVAPQTSHIKGRSSEWTKLCRCRSCLCLRPLSQMVHTYALLLCATCK